MVCSALFLQCALYKVHCANIMHFRKPSFVITPAVLVNTVTRYFFNILDNNIRHILPKQFHLITFDINLVKHPWFSPCTWRNYVMFNRRCADSKRFRPHSRALAVRFFVLRLWRHGIEWDWDVITDEDNGWGECIVQIGSDIYAWNARCFDPGLICYIFLIILHSML